MALVISIFFQLSFVFSLIMQPLQEGNGDTCILRVLSNRWISKKGDARSRETGEVCRCHIGFYRIRNWTVDLQTNWQNELASNFKEIVTLTEDEKEMGKVYECISEYVKINGCLLANFWATHGRQIVKLGAVILAGGASGGVVSHIFISNVILS